MKNSRYIFALMRRGSALRQKKPSDVMRKQTLAGVCYLMSFVIVFGLRVLVHALDVNAPPLFYVSPYIASFILAPLLYIPLAKLNRRLLAWRKARGRDIEEEEKYENVSAGIISIKPAQSDDEDLFRRPWK